MKTKEHNRQVENTVLERFKAASGLETVPSFTCRSENPMETVKRGGGGGD